MSALGAEFKINVHMEPIDGFHMADEKVDFECYLYVNTNKGACSKRGNNLLYSKMILLMTIVL